MWFGKRCSFFCCFRCSLGFRGKDATSAPIIDASRAKNELFVKSSRLFHASLKLGSCGNGVSGWMKVKKSLMRRSRVSIGHIDSADKPALEVACDESAARA